MRAHTGDHKAAAAAYRCVTLRDATNEHFDSPIVAGTAAASWLKEQSIACRQYCFVSYALVAVCKTFCSDVFTLCDVMDALHAAARTLHRDTSATAAAALAETIRQGCKDVQLRAVFLAQVRPLFLRNQSAHSRSQYFLPCSRALE